VTVIPLPTIAIAGPAVACDALTTNLTFTFTGTPPFSYSYTDGISTFTGSSATTTATVGIVPPGVAGETFTYSPLSVSDARCTGDANSLGSSATVVVVPQSDLTGVTLTSNKAFDNICVGDQVTLSLNGIDAHTLGYQAHWKWYRGGCGTGSGGTLIASDVTSITVNPTVNTRYYVRAEGYCNNTSCLDLAVIVSTAPPSGNPVVLQYPVIAYAGAQDSIVLAPVSGAIWYRWTSGGNSRILFDGHPGPYQSTSPSVALTFVNPSSNGNGIGNYHISFFAGNACGRTNTNNLQIRATVAAPTAISGPNVACTGQTRSYSITPIVGAKSYVWSFSSGNGTITGNGTTTVNVTFTALPATLCVHGVTAFNSDGPDLCMNITTNIATPGAVSGDTLPCPSTTKTYSISPVIGAVSYDWTTTVPGATISGTGASATVTYPAGTFSGNVCVRAYSGCGYSGTSCLAIVNGSAAPVGAITGMQYGLCGATGVNYQIPATGDTVYTWSVPAGATITSGQGTNSILVDFSGSFTGGVISIVASNACGSAGGSLVVSALPSTPVITGPGAACADDESEYTAASVGATSYVWSVDPSSNAFISSSSPDQITVLWVTNGGTVSVTASNTCGSVSSSLVVGSSCRLAGDPALIETLKASVYPNPTQGNLTLEFLSPENDSYSVKVTDLAGRLVYSEQLTGIEGLNRHEMDFTKLAKGMYKLALENGQGESVVMKVVVE
jgi:hypothetical protein